MESYHNYLLVKSGITLVQSVIAEKRNEWGTNMKLSDLKYFMDHYRDQDDLEVVVCVERVGTVGATPTVSIKTANAGFDWDQGRLMLYPEKNLREIDRDEIAALRKNYDELGWSLYKINNIKRENKQLKEQVRLLKQELDQLKRG
jgi:hypothetical protein